MPLRTEEAEIREMESELKAPSDKRSRNLSNVIRTLLRTLIEKYRWMLFNVRSGKHVSAVEINRLIYRRKPLSKKNKGS